MGKSLSLAVVLAALGRVACPVLAQVAQWDGHPDGQTHWYELIGDGKGETLLSWGDARVAAENSTLEIAPGIEANGYLATMTSAEENTFAGGGG